MVRRIAARQKATAESTNDSADMPKLTDEQLAGMMRFKDRRKVPVSVRLDPQVLEWLKGKGQGHLTRINDILEYVMLMEAKSQGSAGTK